MLAPSAARPPPPPPTHTIPTPTGPPPHRLLHRLEEQQRQRHEEFLALLQRNKIELAAMLGGGAAEKGVIAGNATNAEMAVRPAARWTFAAQGSGHGREPAEPLMIAGWETGRRQDTVGGRLKPLLPVPEICSGDEEFEIKHSKWAAGSGRAAGQPAGSKQQLQQQQHPQLQQQWQVAALPTKGTTTPAARERAHRAMPAAVAATATPAPARQAARSRKRSASVELEAATVGTTKRRAGRRRSSATEVISVSVEAAAGDSLLGKRTRRLTTDQQDAAGPAPDMGAGAADTKKGRRS